MGRQYEPETKCFKGTTATLMGIRIRPPTHSVAAHLWVSTPFVDPTPFRCLPDSSSILARDGRT